MNRVRYGQTVRQDGLPAMSSFRARVRRHNVRAPFVLVTLVLILTSTNERATAGLPNASRIRPGLVPHSRGPERPELSPVPGVSHDTELDSATV